MDIFGAIAIALLLLLGRDQIAHGVLTPGAFVAFIAAVFSLYNPVRKFALFNNNFQQALGASSELFKFMDSEDEVREKPGAKPLPAFSSSIRFDDVSFSYEGNGDGAREILRNINLKVKAGEVLAVVGSSGAGKSTLVHLIPRFFDVTSGALLIDGRDVRDTTLASLRSLIGVVTQETVLFNDTVRNNIAYGQPDVSQREVEAAAQAALAHDFIMELPAGYYTIIGERGVRLSGGERQRIAIARALLKNAPILILDEATSALDSESEALVQSALQNLMSGRTVFVIAHRLSTVRRADRIVVLENGTIADIGAHEELMQKLGTYRRLLKEKLARGHLELSLNLERGGGESLSLNRQIVGGYIQAFRAAAAEFGLAAEPDLNAIMRIPGALDAAALPADGAVEASVLGKVEEVLERLNQMREEEGRGIERELRDRMEHVQHAGKEIEKHRHAVLQGYVGRLKTRMQELIGTQAEPERILQEAALLVDRSDIQEELVRLDTHVKHFLSQLDQKGEVGKKLDFLLQEMNREANTLLSKTSGLAGEALDITQMGLAIKADIEKAREQVQNVE